MIIRARFVVSMDGPPIEDGAVAVSHDRIVDVGTFAEIKARYAGEVIDLGEQALLPGLINAHCHLDYTCLRGKIPSPESFTDWIRAINAEKAKLSPEDYAASICEGFAEAKSFGTTTIANLEAFPDLIGQLDEPIRTWWFAELIDVREPGHAKMIVDRAIDSLKGTKHWGLAPHAPFTASGDLYRYAVEAAERNGVLLTTHLAESEEEMQMSFDLGGPLCHFLDSIGGDLFEYNGVTPVKHMLETCRFDSRWIVAHLNAVLDGDLEMLAQSDKCHVVHCPRSHKYFGHLRFQFEKLQRLGFNICLGTDSLASNEDLSLFAEMRAFQKMEPDLPAEELLAMVTVNAARALGQEGTLGSLRRESFADLIAVPFSEPRKNLFEAIVAFEGAPWVMAAGKTAAS